MFFSKRWSLLTVRFITQTEIAVMVVWTILNWQDPHNATTAADGVPPKNASAVIVGPDKIADAGKAPLAIRLTGDFDAAVIWPNAHRHGNGVVQSVN